MYEFSDIKYIHMVVPFLRVLLCPSFSSCTRPHTCIVALEHLTFKIRNDQQRGPRAACTSPYWKEMYSVSDNHVTGAFSHTLLITACKEGRCCYIHSLQMKKLRLEEVRWHVCGQREKGLQPASTPCLWDALFSFFLS